MSTDKLVEKYLDIERTVYWLHQIGFGSAAGAAAAGTATLIERGSVSEASKKVAGRTLGRGPIAEALQKRFGPRLSPRAGAVAIIAIAGGTTAYYAGLQQLEHIQAILMDRHQNGKMNEAQFEQVFGDTIDPLAVKKYWQN